MPRALYHTINTTLVLLKRDVTVRYTDSLLGPLWIVAYPLVLTLVSSIVFSFVFRGTVEEAPYFLYVMVGFVSWIFFSQTTSAATRSFVSNRDIICNNKIPTESIVAGVVLSRLLDYYINLVFLIVFIVAFSKPPTLFSVLLVLLVSIVQTCLQIGISLITASANAYYRDVQNVIDIILQILFYTTPIVYHVSIVPERLRFLAYINPLTYAIDVYRAALFGRPVPAGEFAVFIGVAVTTLLVGAVVHNRLKHAFAEVL